MSDGMHIRRINPATLAAPTGYTHVVEVTAAARTLYVAGQVAFDWRRDVVGVGDMAAQAEQVYRNLEAALAAGGASFSDVVKMTTFVTDMSQAPAARAVRARYFGDMPPANTLVEVKALIEIEVVAALAK
jgi:2-iminobutanoate/2-iminopropanoate deaminase